MFRRSAVLLCMLLCAAPELSFAQPVQIPVGRSAAQARKDLGDGLCVTAVHVPDPTLGQVPFSSVDDALGVLNRTSPRLTEDGRVSTVYSLINFRNNDAISAGDFDGDIVAPFSDSPGAVPPGNDRNFAMRLRGYINVDGADPAGLKRTLGIYADDGARLLVGGIPITVPDIDERLSTRRIRQVQYGGSGLYPIELLYYQNGSGATLEFSESSQWIPENTRLTNLHDLGFTLVGEPRPNLFVNTELYTARLGAVSKCIECTDDSSCPAANYCVKDWGPTPPAGLCQACNVASHCGPSCTACGTATPICHQGGCIQCLEDKDCATGLQCNQTSHQCEQPYENWGYVGGCSAAPPANGNRLGLYGAAAAMLLVLAFQRLRRRRSSRSFRAGSGLILVSAIFVAMSPGVAQAQLSANIETFHPAIGQESIITVEGTRTGKRWRPLFVALLEYSHRPMRLIDRDTGNTLATTVPDMVSLHLMAGVGLTRWLALAVDLPVIVYQSFDRATPMQDVPSEPASYGVGDFRMVAKFRIINNEHGGFGLAFVPQVTFPTGDATQLRSDDAFGIEPRLALDYRTPGGAVIALNAGFLGRTSNQIIRGMEVGSQLRYGLGMFVPLPEGFGLMGEVAGGTSVMNVQGGHVYSPLEGHVGGRWVHASGFNLNLGAGMGFTEAVGSPQFRFFASVGYLPIERATVPTPPSMGRVLIEKAGSGTGVVISGPRGIDCGQSCTADFKLGTQVVLQARPGADSRFIGWSGPCSGTDECVFIVRGATRIGTEFARNEEKRSTLTIEREGDGQGEVIGDSGGLSCGKVCSASYRQDQEVRLVAVPDKDSRFAGWEGACSGMEPCTLIVRGDPRVKARFIKSQIVVTEQKLDLQGNVVHFETAKSNIDIDSYHLLDEVVLILKQMPRMRLRIEGHTDAVPFNAPGGNLQLSKDRAASVLQYLVGHGIEGGRLSSEGFGDTCPVATNQSPEGRQANRRTEFLIMDAAGKYQRTPCVTYTPAPKMGRWRKPTAVQAKPGKQQQQIAPK